MAAVTVNNRYDVPDPHKEVLKVTAAADGGTYTSIKFSTIDSVEISPNSTSWAATEAYSATVSGNVVTFKLIGTATYPFWVEITGRG